MSRQRAKYQPAEDRFKLAHWLNVSQNRWADRLATQYPTLSNGEKDICYLFAIGFSFEEMADLLQIQPRSVDRSVYRICKKMGFEQGNKEEFVKQLKFLNTQP
jgi:DNA-binding CsgD family transcriptional regulator